MEGRVVAGKDVADLGPSLSTPEKDFILGMMNSLQGMVGTKFLHTWRDEETHTGTIYLGIIIKMRKTYKMHICSCLLCLSGE